MDTKLLGRRTAVSLAAAAVLVLSLGAAAVARIGSRGSSSQQVAARGAALTGPGEASGISPSGAGAGPPGAQGSGGPGTSGASVATSTTPPGTGGPPSSSAGAGGRTATTGVPTSSTLATSPPAPSTTTTSSGGAAQVQGTVVFGPVCPVERIPPDPACAPRPGAAHIQLVRADGTVAAQGDAGSDGRFAIGVVPGSYTVNAASLPPAPAIGRGCTATPTTVMLAPGAVAHVDVSCDTGIR